MKPSLGHHRRAGRASRSLGKGGLKWLHAGLILVLLAQLSWSQTDERGPEMSPSTSGRIKDLESRGGAQIVSLGNGRGRLRVPLDVSENSVADESVRDEVAQESPFVLSWLREDLPHRFKGLESVDLIETNLRRDHGRGVVETMTREIELRGELPALRAAESYLDELLALRRLHIRVRGRFVVRPRQADETWAGRVELLDYERLRAVEDELVATRGREFARLDFDLADLKQGRVRNLDELRFVRRYEVAELEDGPLVMPVLGSVFEGVQGTVSAFLLPGAKELALSLDFGLGVIIRPVPKSVMTVDGREREVLAPEVATRRWRQPSVVLGPNVVALAVRGLPFPGSEGVEREAREELVLVVNVEIEALPRRTLMGQVLGYDESQKLAFAKVHAQANVHPGMRLAVTRNNRLIGRAEVVEIVGSMMTLRPLEGLPQHLDELR